MKVGLGSFPNKSTFMYMVPRKEKYGNFNMAKHGAIKGRK